MRLKEKFKTILKAKKIIKYLNNHDDLHFKCYYPLVTWEAQIGITVGKGRNVCLWG